MKRPRLWATLVLMATLAIGAVGGAGAATWLITRRIQALFDGPPGAVNARLYGYELSRRFHLSAATRAEVERVVQEDHAEVARIVQTVEPQLLPIRKRRHAKLRALIPPAQQAAYDEQVARFERRYRESIDLPPAPTP